MQPGAPADRGPEPSGRPRGNSPPARPPSAGSPSGIPPNRGPVPPRAVSDGSPPLAGAPGGEQVPDDDPPPPPDAWTVARILEWTTGHLKKNGSTSPRLDAELLLAHARKCPRIQLYVQHSQIVTDAQRAVMRDLVQRRAGAEPVAYLIGKREFFSLDFEVTRDTLIPRPETETLVLEGLELAKTIESPRVLDVGTGTGCVAVALAKHRPGLIATAVDLSEGALAVARRNVARHGLESRVTLLHSDLCGSLPTDARFHLIVSNPPYIGDEELADLPPDVRLHEPHSALLAGPKGMTILARLTREAPPFLEPDGWLLMELDPDQAPAVRPSDGRDSD
jgi:release factor glutamine methyltransferase